MSDPINPAHYKRGGIEAIDVIEAWELGFHLSNVIKYVCRAGLKQSYLEDLKKAEYYLNRAIWRELERTTPKQVEQSERVKCSEATSYGAKIAREAFYGRKGP